MGCAATTRALGCIALARRHAPPGAPSTLASRRLASSHTQGVPSFTRHAGAGAVHGRAPRAVCTHSPRRVQRAQRTWVLHPLHHGALRHDPRVVQAEHILQQVVGHLRRDYDGSHTLARAGGTKSAPGSSSSAPLAGAAGLRRHSRHRAAPSNRPLPPLHGTGGGPPALTLVRSSVSQGVWR